MKTPKASGALRWAPDPMPRYARFARPTLLRYVGKIGRTRTGAPLDQILDPLLVNMLKIQQRKVGQRSSKLGDVTKPRTLDFNSSIF